MPNIDIYVQNGYRAKNQIDLGKEKLRALAQPSAPAQKPKYSFKRNEKFVQVENFMKINKRVGT